jgi:hypothetical protein
MGPNRWRAEGCRERRRPTYIGVQCPAHAVVADIAVQLGEGLRDRYLLERKLGQGGMATVYLTTFLTRRDPSCAVII